MIAVVDYHKGNLKSVERGLMAAGAQALITDDPAVIARADAIVLPGVGAFADASATMHELGQMGVIRERVAQGVPFLGICLGMHLMFEEGIEGSPEEDDELSTNNAKGLAILPGVVGALPRFDAEGNAYKVPHVGWNSVVPPACRPAELLDAAVPSGGPSLTSLGEPAGAGVPAPHFDSPLFEGIALGEFFYFTHSYIVPDTPATIATTQHSMAFPCAVQYRDAAFGVQFHPEKSSDSGAQLLRNFVRIAGEAQ